MTKVLHAELATKGSKAGRAQAKASGPSLYEMNYLKQLAEELNIFLHSRGFSTIEAIDLGIVGHGYRGHVHLAR